METTADKRSLLHSVNFKIPEQCEVNGCRTFLTHFEYIQVSLCCLTAFHKIISIGLNALIRHYKCDFFFPLFKLVSASLTIFPLFLFFSFLILLIFFLTFFFSYACFPSSSNFEELSEERSVVAVVLKGSCLTFFSSLT